MKDTPQEGDYVISCPGLLGSLYSVGVYQGECLGTLLTWDQCREVIRYRIEEEQRWSNVWWVSDNGYILMDMLGQESEGYP